MRRHGFTILELTLATMVGSLVLLTALGVFASMDRGDRVLSARAVENNGLEMAAVAIENAIGTLVMESGGQASRGATASPNADGSDAGRGASPAPGRARFLLETDTAAGLPGMPEVADAAAGTAGSATPLLGTLSSPQRLELVLARHPIPVDARPVDPGSEGGATTGMGAGDKPMAVRGVFDLRPEPVRVGATGPATWTLWWRPIEQRLDDSGTTVFVGADDLAVPLARHLISARWSVFYEEAWTSSHLTAAVLDLPAYVKLQATTASGLEADWLFEVGWSIGPEFKSDETTGDGEATDEDEQEGGIEAEQDRADQPLAPSAATPPRSEPRRVAPTGPGKPAKPGAIRPPQAPRNAPGGPR